MSNFLVIGGSSGIGCEVAKMLTKEGHEVFASFRTNESDLRAPSFSQFQFDVLTDELDPALFPEEIHGLVYCPGAINLRAFRQLSLPDFQEDLNLQVLGAVKVIKAALPSLKKAKKSSIVLFSSVAVQMGFPFHAQVAVSKGAIEGLTRSLAAEFAPDIRVNAVAPSLTDTPLASRLLSSVKQREGHELRHPLKRIGSVVDIAHAVTYLLSKESSWITGQIQHVDGGMSSLRA